ncbi:MAG: acetyl-CoA carboxylase biotin carboxylase subunit, partial [Pyrinomonadaceae bacterium]
IRACRDLGISPVAVYSEADAEAVHVRLADEAVCIGPAPSTQSYLNIAAIVEAAKQTKAAAIHPGYGFLAENANFARAIAAAGLSFIGPTAAAMETMGSKTSARGAAVDAGVSIVPGTVEPLNSLSEAQSAAEQFGYPVMLKASAGGGGKGMRLVSSPKELQSAFDNAGSEAAGAFGDASLYLEKVVERPRHIEIQVFADSHGNVVHLGERECSIQRRHQKVVEECPSPINDTHLRQRMGEAAVKIARAVDYVGAGTVEFLVADATREFYFLEMNTRLQVEHPVTELVTGIDLVREQIMVAAGAHLSFSQKEIVWRGHAIECRVYAEDPDNNFLPSPGIISFLQLPSGPGIREDSGVRVNTEVSIHYDPMISKLAAWGRSRTEAIDRLRRALDEYQVGGIKTTLAFFREIVRDEEFIDGRLDTGFIARFNERRAVARRFVSTDSDQIEIRRRDMALVAGAIHYAKLQREASLHRQPAGQAKNRWKTAGRTALIRRRTVIDKRAKKLRGPGGDKA